MEQNEHQYYNKPEPPNKSKPPKKPMEPAVVIVCVICGCIMFIGFWVALFGQFFGNMFGALSSSSMDQYVEEPYWDTIDIIRVEGTIAEGQIDYQHQWTLSTIDNLMDSESNKGILLYVNSPGGGTYESDELYLKLKQYKEETGRPVYAYMAQTAASGGLYVCMAADYICANRMSMTGSIGVIMSLTDTTGLQKLIGIKEENIVSGKNKAMGNPLTEEQRGILQSMVNESYDIFVDIVAENRNLDEDVVRKLADGRVYSPQQAIENGLIDEVASFEDTVGMMLEIDGLEDCEIYEHIPPTSMLDQILYGVETNIGGQSAQLEKINSYIEDNKSPKLMYYMQ